MSYVYVEQFVPKIQELYDKIDTQKDSMDGYKLMKDQNMNKILEFISKASSNWKAIEKYEVVPLIAEKFAKSAAKLHHQMPIKGIYSNLAYIISKEYQKILTHSSKNLLLNKGQKCNFDINNTSSITSSITSGITSGITATHPNITKVHYERWVNIVNKENLDEILFTFHNNVKLDKENKHVSFTYKIKGVDLNLFLIIQEKEGEYFEVYTKEEFKLDNDVNTSEMKYFTYVQNSYSEIFCMDSDKNRKLTGRIISQNTSDNASDTSVKVSKEYTKEEFLFGYKEVSGEWYVTLNNGESYGNKYFNNSSKRSYEEEWWKREDNLVNYCEMKIRKKLDDGLGVKTHETFGYKDENFKRIYQFCDKTIDVVYSGDVTTTKEGWDQTSSWKSFNYSNKCKNINHVENYGKISNSAGLSEWFEKWYESPDHKYCKKWGKVTEREWEEEWKENFDADNQIKERKCFKKCYLFHDNYQWFETWTENFDKVERKIHKHCQKTNENTQNGYKVVREWFDVNSY